MVSWKCPVLEEVALGADAAEGVWAQAQREHDISRAELPVIAAEALADRVIRGNPREIGGTDDILEILELAW